MITMGLDLSTTKVGIFALDENGEKLLWDYVNLTSSKIEKDLISRADAFFLRLTEILECANLQPDEIDWAIEAPLFINPFSGIKSNPNTIAKLIAFNWMIVYTLHKLFNIRAEHINVNSARKIVFGSLPKGTDKKAYVLEQVIKMFPEIGEIPKKYRDDVSDAYVIARARYELRQNSSSENGVGGTQKK
jgi:hypothetical protein